MISEKVSKAILDKIEDLISRHQYDKLMRKILHKNYNDIIDYAKAAIDHNYMGKLDINFQLEVDGSMQKLVKNLLKYCGKCEIYEVDILHHHPNITVAYDNKYKESAWSIFDHDVFVKILEILHCEYRVYDLGESEPNFEFKVNIELYKEGHKIEHEYSLRCENCSYGMRPIDDHMKRDRLCDNCCPYINYENHRIKYIIKMPKQKVYQEKNWYQYIETHPLLDYLYGEYVKVNSSVSIENIDCNFIIRSKNTDHKVHIIALKAIDNGWIRNILHKEEKEALLKEYDDSAVLAFIDTLYLSDQKFIEKYLKINLDIQEALDLANYLCYDRFFNLLILLIPDYEEYDQVVLQYETFASKECIISRFSSEI
jgi:hypothetical protein